MDKISFLVFSLALVLSIQVVAGLGRKAKMPVPDATQGAADKGAADKGSADEDDESTPKKLPYLEMAHSLKELELTKEQLKILTEEIQNDIKSGKLDSLKEVKEITEEEMEKLHHTLLIVSTFTKMYKTINPEEALGKLYPDGTQHLLPQSQEAYKRIIELSNV